MELGRAMRIGCLIATAIGAAACAAPQQRPPRDVQASKASPPVTAAAAAAIEAPAPVPLPEADVFARAIEAPVAFDDGGWRSFGVARCAYLAPTSDFIASDGGVDFVVQFHAGQMASRDMKESGVRGVFVSCGYGRGSSGYARAFDDPARFGRMMTRLTRAIGRQFDRTDVHVRRLALTSWSAGFAAVNRVLSVPEWYDATDTLVLLDSLHAPYVRRSPHTSAQSAQGRGRVDVRALERFVRFAKDAALGKKTMVVTHSSIVPPGYASTTEATAALLDEVGVAPIAASSNDDDELGMRRSWPGATLSLRADRGGLHVRGFRGVGPHDHFDHLHMIGIALRSWLVPRWYTPTSERP